VIEPPPDVLAERLKMLLFEVGADPDLVSIGLSGVPRVDMNYKRGMSREIGWRAYTLAMNDPAYAPCWGCWKAGTAKQCHAARPFLEDCGKPR